MLQKVGLDKKKIKDPDFRLKNVVIVPSRRDGIKVLPFCYRLVMAFTVTKQKIVVLYKNKRLSNFRTLLLYNKGSPDL